MQIGCKFIYRIIYDRFQVMKNRANQNESEVRMLIHTGYAGVVIGRAGFKIKELKDTHSLSDLKVNILKTKRGMPGTGRICNPRKFFGFFKYNLF